MKKTHLLTCLMTVCLLVSVGLVGQAMASGFAIIEQSVRGSGTAYAGAASVAEDASTIFFNPAGMTRLSGHHLELGGHYIVPKAEFSDRGSTNAAGAPFTGGNGGDGGEPALVPNFYFTYSISQNFKAGLGVHAPYGLKTEYDRDWVGRYYAVESDLQTLNINPSVAYRINPQWSVGAGVSIERAEATLSNKADFGFAANPALSQQHDGFAEVTGDDWGYGVNLGVLFEMSSATRFGLAYRSTVSHKLEGEVKWQYETATALAVATAGSFVNGDASAEVDLPATVTLSAYHELNSQWALMADLTWTQWSNLDELRIKYTSGQPDTVTTLSWDDTWRYSLGVVFKPTSQLALRAGAAFDESPIPSAQARTPRIPGADRTWVSVGCGYQFSPKVELNFGYSHLFVDDPEINKTATGEDLLRGNLTGTYDASVDIVSANLAFRF